MSDDIAKIEEALLLEPNTILKRAGQLNPVYAERDALKVRVAELEAAEKLAERFHARLQDHAQHSINCDCTGFDTDHFTKPYPTCANLMDAYQEWVTARVLNKTEVAE